MSEELRTLAEAIVDTYNSKCDTVFPDGSSAEDDERDLLLPIAALCEEVRRETVERCAKVCRDIGITSNESYSIRMATVCAEAIERLSDEPIQAHSKSEYKRLVTQGANVVPPLQEE